MLYRVYRLINLLNIDVAVGAMASALFFARQMNAPVRQYGIAALGLTVWAIYTADRLMDVRHLTQPPVSERHRFHLQHRHVLWIAVMLAILIVAALIFFLRPSVRLGGIILAPLIVCYLFLQKKLPVKEIAVALLYTLGVLLPAWPDRLDTLTHNAILVGLFFLVALTNVLLFAWFESDADNQMGQSSMVTRLGRKRVSAILITLLAIGTVATLVYVFFNTAALILSGMWLVLVCLFWFHTFFAPCDRYRLWGDAIFYLPILGLL